MKSSKTKRIPKVPEKRMIQSHHMLMNLILDGRKAACEICGSMGEDLELHHIMPVSIKPVHSNDNLAILCRDHHALIERYYWWERSKLMPDEAREIKEIARMFKARAVPPTQISTYQNRTRELWAAMNTHPRLSNPQWWAKTFADGKIWSYQQQVLRSVDPKDAIIEDPWFQAQENLVT